MMFRPLVVRHILLSFIFIVFFSSCSHVMKKDEVKNEFRNDFYALQAVPASFLNTSVLESLVFKNAQTQKLLTQIEFNDKGLHMVAMTYSGLPIIQAKWQYNVGFIELISQRFPHAVVMRMIRDIQWVKWPIHSIRKGLLDKYSLDEFSEKNYKIRQIKYNNTVLVKITYRSDHIVLENTAEKYALVIEQLNDK